MDVCKLARHYFKKFSSATTNGKEVIISKQKARLTTLGLLQGLAGRCINGHFVAINMSCSGQASLSFCWLTFTFISLFSSGSGLDEQ